MTWESAPTRAKQRNGRGKSFAPRLQANFECQHALDRRKRGQELFSPRFVFVYEPQEKRKHQDCASRYASGNDQLREVRLDRHSLAQKLAPLEVGHELAPAALERDDDFVLTRFTLGRHFGVVLIRPCNARRYAGPQPGAEGKTSTVPADHLKGNTVPSHLNSTSACV